MIERAYQGVRAPSFLTLRPPIVYPSVIRLTRRNFIWENVLRQARGAELLRCQDQCKQCKHTQKVKHYGQHFWLFVARSSPSNPCA
jgi:hypothetical protein